MVFYKKVEIRDQKDRLGGCQRGIFALERIEKGERIWFCECGEKDGSYTRKQLLDLIRKYPKLDYFVRSFSYMIDDDLYALPHGYMEEKNNDECALFNHSCNPTCGFAEDGFGDNVVAVRDIEPGEELTYHYGILETEASLIYGLICKCNSSNCCGVLTFDYYRDPDFVAKFFDYMTPYLKQKSIDMKQKWYSRNCYVKRYFPLNQFKPVSSSSSISSTSDDSTDDSSIDLEEYPKGLCSLRTISNGELVATFNVDNPKEINESKHFIRNCINANCVLIGFNVYASMDIPPETELTLHFERIINLLY